MFAAEPGVTTVNNNCLNEEVVLNGVYSKSDVRSELPRYCSFAAAAAAAAWKRDYRC